MIAIFLWLACSDPPPPEPDPEPLVEPEAEEAEVEAEDTGQEPDENANPHPPRIKKVEISPGKPTVEDELTVEVVTQDADGDYVDVDLQWFVDDRKLLARTSKTLSLDQFEKESVVHVSVVASDGTNEVKATSKPITINNADPEFTSDPRLMTSIDGFRVKAEDPDGDTLEFRLEGAPKGMEISSMGILSYKGSPSESGGKYQVRVIVEDGDKGRATWSFGIAVNAGSQAPEPSSEE